MRKTFRAAVLAVKKIKRFVMKKSNIALKKFFKRIEPSKEWLIGGYNKKLIVKNKIAKYKST